MPVPQEQLTLIKSQPERFPQLTAHQSMCYKPGALVFSVWKSLSQTYKHEVAYTKTVSIGYLHL